MQPLDDNRGPYKGLVPYTENDARLFFGRESDQQIIAANLYAARLTILYGASGVGKSSVLEAGIAADIHRQEARAIVVFNNWKSDPLAELKQAIAREIARVLGKQVGDHDHLPLHEFLRECEQGLAGPLAIVLDQFEEYFLYYPEDEGPDSFAAQFARAVNDGERRVSFLISIREDALSRLDRFERRIPGLFDNYLRLEHLSRDAASKAITEPLRVYNQALPAQEQFDVEPGLIDKVINEVKIGQVFIGQLGRGQVAPPGAESPDGTTIRVEAPYLQLVLTRLWQEETRAHSRVLRSATLDRLGGAETIIRSYLDSAMGSLKPAQQEVAAQIFYYLVTPSGMKIALTPGDLAGFAALSPARVRTVVMRLAERDLRILRPVASAVVEQAEPRYEIFHDVLALAVLDWRSRYLGRSTFSSRLAAAVAVIVVIVAVATDLVSPSAQLISTVLRAASLLVIDTAALLQLYRWFFRYVLRYTASAGSTSVYSGPALVVPFGVLLTAFWYSSTTWRGIHSINVLAMIDARNFIGYQLVTAMLTLLFGFLTFLAMRIAGKLTQRIARRFELGYYGIYIFLCISIAIMIILTWLGYVQPWINITDL